MGVHQRRLARTFHTPKDVDDLGEHVLRLVLGLLGQLSSVKSLIDSVLQLGAISYLKILSNRSFPAASLRLVEIMDQPLHIGLVQTSSLECLQRPSEIGCR
jgi:hypothetical protein